MKYLHRLFVLAHLLIIALFFICGIALLGLACVELWHGLDVAGDMSVRQRFAHVLEALGMLTIALVALELGQTISEEEVQRDVKASGPTRVRRFLSRFMVVIVVALSIEALIAVFQLLHRAPEQLLYAAAIGAMAALLLLAWGGFIYLNRSAEELEPEAMQDAKDEDREVDNRNQG